MLNNLPQSALKTASKKKKKKIQETAEATGDFIGNKIMNISKKYHKLFQRQLKVK